jgi:hypothetical protein
MTLAHLTDDTLASTINGLADPDGGAYRARLERLRRNGLVLLSRPAGGFKLVTQAGAYRAHLTVHTPSMAWSGLCKGAALDLDASPAVASRGTGWTHWTVWAKPGDLIYFTAPEDATLIDFAVDGPF